MKVARFKIYGFGARVGSSAGVGIVELSEATCDEGMRLLAIYSEAWTAFQDALDRKARKRTYAVLCRARRIYLEHVREHRCRKVNSPSAWPDSSSVEEPLRAAVFRAQEQLELAWATLSEVSRLSIDAGATSDGTVALTEAKQLWAAARKRYTSALRRFSDYVVRGKLSEGP
jgi:hypothetical protein